MLKYMSIICLTVLFGSSHLLASDFINDLERISQKSRFFQKSYVKHKLKKIQKTYKLWIQESSTEEFRAHLAYSKNGAKLLNHLRSNSSSSDLLKSKYQALIDENLTSMISIVNRFYSKDRNFTMVYAQVKPYIVAFFQIYSELLNDVITHAEFKQKEAEIVAHLQSLKLSSLSKQMIRISIMLQTQQMGLSYSKAQH
ncbi:MAG: hypothetical protein KC646_09250 [Candidatus Cloacimonetes bacterium]|nr:hypothetical protein [Candidatus Cloacimonadota bacterium]